MRHRRLPPSRLPRTRPRSRPRQRRTDRVLEPRLALLLAPPPQVGRLATRRTRSRHPADASSTNRPGARREQADRPVDLSHSTSARRRAIACQPAGNTQSFSSKEGRQRFDPDPVELDTHLVEADTELVDAVCIGSSGQRDALLVQQSEQAGRGYSSWAGLRSPADDTSTATPVDAIPSQRRASKAARPSGRRPVTLTTSTWASTSTIAGSLPVLDRVVYPFQTSSAIGPSHSSAKTSDCRRRRTATRRANAQSRAVCQTDTGAALRRSLR